LRTSWEFPEIVVGKYRMISDADGKQYPWYGSKTEVQTVDGPTIQPTHVTIHMNDNFFPQACARVCLSVCLSVSLSQAGITTSRPPEAAPRPPQVQKVEGPMMHVTIHMNDNFFPQA